VASARSRRVDEQRRAGEVAAGLGPGRAARPIETPLPSRRETDGAVEAMGVEILLLDQVGDAGLDRLHFQLGRHEAGGEDHGRPAAPPVRLAREFDAAVAAALTGQPVVAQAGVVAAGQQPGEPGRRGRRPVRREAHALGPGQQVADQEELVLLVVDHEDAQRLGHGRRGDGGRRPGPGARHPPPVVLEGDHGGGLRRRPPFRRRGRRSLRQPRSARRLLCRHRCRPT
jgi:hypothetical protein